MKLTAIISTLMLCLMMIPIANNGEMASYSEDDEEHELGNEFSPWLSHQEVVPMRRATLVRHDNEGLWDDYAYMAAVPTSVFSHKGGLYSSPLLFYNPPYEAQGNADLTMNSYQGLDYFMQDWGAVAQIEELELIDVPAGDIPWETGNHTELTGTDIYSLSSELALRHWESSDRAVVAVVKDYPEVPKDDHAEGELNGTIPALPLKNEEFYGTKSVGIAPVYHNFTIDYGYSYLHARMEWGMVWTAGSEERGKDLDLQVYDWQLGEVAASENWNVIDTPGVRPYEDTSSCIYHPGPWAAAVTYMPTEALEDEACTPPEAPWDSDADY
ncbi:MAG: hypothetical protein KAU14_07910 [Thermoplasmata archaeon]|nr:hypothetical protein [Thermoplasmata archaeon]